MDDESLMEKYQKGDCQAFETLYARHQAKVFGYLVKRLKDVAAAEEVFQNAFVKLHRSRALYDPSRPFVKWLFVVARSELLDYLKAQKLSLPLLEEPSFEPVHLSSLEETADVSSLSEREKTALSMRYWEEADFAQIALALDTSDSNARQLISRGLKKLKMAFAGDGK